MRFVFYAIDKGSKWEISQLNTVAGEFRIYGFSDYKEIEIKDFELYDYVNNLLQQNKRVFLPKYEFDSEYTVSDVIVQEESDLDTAKRIAIKRAQDIVYHKTVGKISLIDIYTFTLLNNWLINKGYVITDDNTEEKYLEIISWISDIEDENEAEIAIDKLQRYLTAKERLVIAENRINMQRIFEMQINDAESIEQVEELESEYLTKFED